MLELEVREPDRIDFRSASAKKSSVPPSLSESSTSIVSSLSTWPCKAVTVDNRSVFVPTQGSMTFPLGDLRLISSTALISRVSFFFRTFWGSSGMSIILLKSTSKVSKLIIALMPRGKWVSSLLSRSARAS